MEPRLLKPEIVPRTVYGPAPPGESRFLLRLSPDSDSYDVLQLRVVQQLASMSISLSSLHIIQEATIALDWGFRELLGPTKSVSEQIASVRKFYEIQNIFDKVVYVTVHCPWGLHKFDSGLRSSSGGV